jgi:hypothetical protein
MTFRTRVSFVATLENGQKRTFSDMSTLVSVDLHGVQTSNINIS